MIEKKTRQGATAKRSQAGNNSFCSVGDYIKVFNKANVKVAEGRVSKATSDSVTVAAYGSQYPYSMEGHRVEKVCSSPYDNKLSEHEKKMKNAHTSSEDDEEEMENLNKAKKIGSLNYRNSLMGK